MDVFQLSECCQQWSLDTAPNEAGIRMTLAAFRLLKDHSVLRELGVVDVVPAYTKLAVHFDGSEQNDAAIAIQVEQILSSVSEEPDEEAGTLYTFTVDYRGEDLCHVAEFNQLSVAEVIQKHTAPTYWVAVIGFRPHFPYLWGMDSQLATPRLDTPRVRVPAGSVAIGGEQTGIYPEVSPGGWNIIGTTDPSALYSLSPGDRVKFEAGEIQ